MTLTTRLSLVLLFKLMPNCIGKTNTDELRYVTFNYNCYLLLLL